MEILETGEGEGKGNLTGGDEEGIKCSAGVRNCNQGGCGWLEKGEGGREGRVVVVVAAVALNDNKSNAVTGTGGSKYWQHVKC